ncbi:MAG: DedA family protein [Acidobacteria bacterium]|nr:DedA family protein [Acidobacteriota bacterium]
MHRVTDLLQRLAQWIQPLAQSLGAPGIALVAFLDSSFLSLPEVADALLVLAVLHEPLRWPYYALGATLGSTAGCYAIYALARKGGEAFLRKRFRAEHIDRGLGLFRRYGMLVVIVPSILPPPAPFKIFVLLAGIANITPATFLAAVALGRGSRFFGEAWLAYRYGDHATAFIRDNLPAISIWIAVSVGIVGVALAIWRRRTRR